MPTPISLAGQDLIIVQHRWRDLRTLQGFEGEVEWKPLPYSGQSLPNLIYAAGREWMKTASWITRPDPLNGYMAVPLPPYNDPDLTGYVGVQVSPKGETSLTVEVPFNAPLTSVTEEMADALRQLDIPVTVTVGAQVRAVWLTDLAVTSPAPTPPSLFWTTDQTMAAILDTIDIHDQDTDAHADIRAAISASQTPDATVSVKGKSTLMGGTAASPTVPWPKVTGAPTTYPPSGGAGGVLSGSYPNPGFAVDMATQAELDTHSGATNNPHNVTKSQVGLGNADNTSDTNKPVSTAQQAALDGKVGAADSRLSDQRVPTDSSVTNAKVSASAAIAESKLNLASDAAAGTASRRTLGTGAQQALPGDHASTTNSREWSRYVHDTGISAGQVPVWDSGQGKFVPGSVSGGGGGGSYTDEQAQDATAAMWTAGTHTGLSVAYRDVDNAYDASVAYGTTSGTAAQGNDARLSDQRTPTDGSVTDAKVASGAAIAESKLNLASDAVAATASRRTLGTGAQQATAGNDARLSDQRVPTDGSVTDAKVSASAAIAESKLALASDAVAGTASRRTLGTGAQQAAAGNDARLSDQRTPVDGSVTDAKVASGAAIAESKLALASDATAGTASRRSLGTGAQQAAAGNDTRLSDARTPTAHTHPASDLTATGTRDASTYLRGDNTWATPSTSGLTPTASKTAAYTAAPGELVMVDASGGAITITAPATGAGRVFGVKKTDSSTNVVTVVRAGSDTIGSELATSVPIRLNDQATHFFSSGTNWVIPYNHLSLLTLDGRYPAAATVPAQDRTVTANTMAVVGETLRANATSGAITITPPTSPAAGNRVFLTKIDTSVNKVTWSGTVSGDTGGVELGAAGAGVTLLYSGGSWLLESTTAAATGRTGTGSAPSAAGSRNGTYDARTNTYYPSGGSGRTLRAALARAANGGTPNSGSQLVDVVCLGDSRTAGYYSGATPTDSWPSQLRYRLAAAGFPSAGTGLVMAWNNSTALDSRITTTGTWTGYVSYYQAGASGNTLTFTSDVAISNAVVEVYYYSSSSSFTVKVGAGGATTVPAGSGNVVTRYTATGQTIAAGTQIVLTASAATVYIIGFCIRSTTGVLVHSVAYGGISSTVAASNAAVSLQSIVSNINPSVLGVMIGCNDSGSSVSAATHATNLMTITQTNNPNASKFLIVQSPNPTYIDAWPAYVSAQYDQADYLSRPLLDLNDRYISPTLGNAAGLLGSDNTHETVLGAHDLARAVTTMLAA